MAVRAMHRDALRAAGAEMATEPAPPDRLRTREPPLFPTPTTLDEVRPLSLRPVAGYNREGKRWNAFILATTIVRRWVTTHRRWPSGLRRAGVRACGSGPYIVPTTAPGLAPPLQRHPHADRNLRRDASPAPPIAPQDGSMSAPHRDAGATTGTSNTPCRKRTSGCDHSEKTGNASSATLMRATSQVAEPSPSYCTASESGVRSQCSVDRCFAIMSGQNIAVIFGWRATSPP